MLLAIDTGWREACRAWIVKILWLRLLNPINSPVAVVLVLCPPPVLVAVLNGAGITLGGARLLLVGGEPPRPDPSRRAAKAYRV